MDINEFSSDVGDCPDDELLSAFARGLLVTRLLEEVTLHVSKCGACAESVDTLTDGDSLVSDLRRWLGAGPPVTTQPSPVARVSARTDSGDHFKLRGYDLLEELGRGAMGVVYKAWQPDLHRLVAVKVARSALLWNAVAAQRIRTECEAIARLRHSSIVQIHEFGEINGVPYFSMEYCAGGTLADRTAKGPLEAREAARIVYDLARAVEYAHQKGVLHRDLKPANVLMDSEGSVRLSDFGLAKLTDSYEGQTSDDAIIGTPGYMSPEQACGKLDRIGPSTDVYGLGGILYEALAGKPPFSALTKMETLQLVRSEKPKAFSRNRAGASFVLELICLKCLEKQQNRRYPRAQDLADDLERWFRGYKVSVRPPTRFEKTFDALRSNGKLTMAVLMISTAILFGAVCVICFHPDRPLWVIQKKLSASGRVTLIGETGGPAWSKWRVQTDQAQSPVPASDVFSIQSWGLGMLDLIGDPKMKSFRYSAEVRHEESQDFGEVGIYVAATTDESPSGRIHRFVQCSFNDIRMRSGAPVDGNRVRSQSNPMANPVALHPHIYAEGRILNEWDASISGQSFRYCFPAGYRKTTWRKLIVDVNSLGIRAFWEGEQSLGLLSTETMVRGTEELISQAQKANDKHPFASFVHPTYPLNGGVGIFVSRGAAAFKSVTLEPYPEE